MKLRKIVVDPDKCSGCRLCELACSQQHLVDSINPRRARILVEKQEEKGFDVPNVCRQCKRALCAEACPVDAITLDEVTCAWVVDQELCTGCGLCVEACPFGSIHLDIQTGTAAKCDLCRGSKPACVSQCPTGALQFPEEQGV